MNDLRRLQPVSFAEYESNYLIHRTTERLLQIAIEDCLDIGKHIIAEAAFRAPDDNQDIFVVLHDEGLIPKKLLTRLIDMAKFRKLVVHDYVRIDNAIVYGILKRRLVDFEAYAHAIQKYLTQFHQT
jgi:uncharacterized protein YutE (UPF0331/DUF86 family)